MNRTNATAKHCPHPHPSPAGRRALHPPPSGRGTEGEEKVPIDMTIIRESRAGCASRASLSAQQRRSERQFAIATVENPPMTIAAELAQIVTRTPFDRLPPLALDHAAMLIASTLASAASGYDIASSRIIRELASEQAGTPESSIWFDSGPKIPAVNACRVNAVMSDAAASDDSDLRTIVHLGTPLTATTLALAERTGADGKQVLAAIVLGYETAGRIGAAVMPAYRNRGFHGCIVAIFGAAVASAILLRLDQRQMAQAIALAAVSIGGLSAAADTS